MKNDIIRKLTSLTLMTIMVAGGLTFAIPGALPQAAAQTGMISVSSTEMGGYQILEVQINDPDRRALDVDYGIIGATINGDPLQMYQVKTGIWYAYVQHDDLVDDDGAPDDVPTGFSLQGAPDPNTGEGSTHASGASIPITTIPIQEVDLSDGATIEYGNESVDVTYDDDLTGSVSIALDRTDVPNEAQVHITITDPRLNLDPTVEDVWQLTINTTAAPTNMYRTAVVENGPDTFASVTLSNTHGEFSSGALTVAGEGAIDRDNDDDGVADAITFTETESSSGVFVSDDNKESPIKIYFGGDNPLDEQDKVTITYAGTTAALYGASTTPKIAIVADGPWNSGAEITVRLTAPDLNLNTLDDDDLTITGGEVPVIVIDNSDAHDPFTISDVVESAEAFIPSDVGTPDGDMVLRFGNVTVADNTVDPVVAADTVKFTNFTLNGLITNDNLKHYVNYYLSGDGETTVTFANDADNDGLIATTPDSDGVTEATTPAFTSNNFAKNGITSLTLHENVTATTPLTLEVTGTATAAVLVFDIFTFGQDRDSIAANDLDGDVYTLAVYRHELEETTPSSGVFEGTVEYIMLTQVNVQQDSTYGEIETSGSALVIILDDDEGAEVQYGDATTSYDSETHTASVSLDADSYSTHGTITVNLVDADLNMDSAAAERYVLMSDGTVRGSENGGTVAVEVERGETRNIAPGLFLEIKIDGEQWTDNCDDDIIDFPSALTFLETGPATGSFTTDFAIPTHYCDDGERAKVTGESIQAIYTDFRDEDGDFGKWSDSATIQAVTGTISLDRTVYPVPTADKGVTVYIDINDPDHNAASDETESIPADQVTITITSVSEADPIDVTAMLGAGISFDETSEDSGVFQGTITVPTTITRENARDIDIGQSYIISATYEDAQDASGSADTTVTASAIFNIGTATLSVDAPEYAINQNAFVTLVDRDRNYDSDSRETIDLSEISWSGSVDVDLSNTAFDASPPNLKETEPNSGIFLTEITIPEDIQERPNDDEREPVERGATITLEYTDDSPAGADRPGDDDRDVSTSFTILRTGASLNLDKDVYSWRDRVTITVIAPDFNTDGLAVDVIEKDKVSARSQEGELEGTDNGISLTETGPNTGIFQNTIDLGGFDAGSGDGYDVGGGVLVKCLGEQLCVGNEDGISVTFTYDEDERDLVQSALIRWNVAEVTWLEDSYREGSTGTLRVVDPDRNLHSDTPDSISTIVFSDTYRGGIKVTLTETEPASGVFEGDVIFDVLHSEGNRLQVSEGDIVTAAYDDKTLPPPDGEGDRLRITGTTTVGSIVPPLERVAVSNLGVVDALGSAVDSISVGQQVNIAADLTSAQSRSQDYAYLLQIQNMDGVTVHLSWAASSLAGFGGANVSQSWTPDETGSYTATVFVWESLTNPTALSPQNSIDITVV